MICEGEEMEDIEVRPYIRGIGRKPSRRRGPVHRVGRICQGEKEETLRGLKRAL